MYIYDKLNILLEINNLPFFLCKCSTPGELLKYAAPKEPKKIPPFPNKLHSDLEPNLKKNADETRVDHANSEKISSSNVIASAAVRLFKLNQATYAYEAVENGAMLGCVILGSAASYQLLVYNAQVMNNEYEVFLVTLYKHDIFIS